MHTLKIVYYVIIDYIYESISHTLKTTKMDAN